MGSLTTTIDYIAGDTMIETTYSNFMPEQTTNGFEVAMVDETTTMLVFFKKTVSRLIVKPLDGIFWYFADTGEQVQYSDIDKLKRVYDAKKALNLGIL